MTKHFVEFWKHISDSKEAKRRAYWVLIPLKKHNPRARRVLELGVGIGNVMVHFPRKLELYGIDIEPRYIKRCRERIPRGRFFVAGMHNFRIKQKFDLIFSVHDSINFLKGFGRWKATFKNVNAHLSETGLFIFDMYTPKILADFECKKAELSSFSGGRISDKALVKGNTLTWDFRVYEMKKDGEEELHRYLWKETIYPVEKVIAALAPHFDILETRLIEEGRRILFICRKR